MIVGIKQNSTILTSFEIDNEGNKEKCRDVAKII